MNHGVTGTTQRQSKNQSMENCITSETIKGEASQIKCVLICFYDIKGLLQFEFVPQGQTVNQHF